MRHSIARWGSSGEQARPALALGEDKREEPELVEAAAVVRRVVGTEGHMHRTGVESLEPTPRIMNIYRLVDVFGNVLTPNTAGSS